MSSARGSGLDRMQVEPGGPTAPNTFLIGAPKCGTTALAQYLSAHPGGFLSYPKEPSFWSDDLKRAQTVVRLGGLQDYLGLYANAGGHSVILDASTSTLFSKTALPAILEFAPQAKFIVMLRNPVEVAQAYHMEKCFNLFENVSDFEQAWRLQDQRAAGLCLPPLCVEPKELMYRDVAALGTQLDRAGALIPEGRLLVLFYEDLRADPRRMWQNVLAFLGLPDDGRCDFPVIGGAHFNRFPALARFYQNPPEPLKPLIRGTKKMLRKDMGGANLAKRLLVKNKPRDDLSAAFRSELAGFFAPEVEMLEARTGRDLSHWKTLP